VSLKEYRFEHPKTERFVTIGRWSYVWAGLLGAIYVWRIGYGSILRAAAINIAFALGVTAIVLGSSALPSLQQLFVLMVVCPLAVLTQGTLMISLIRDGFRRRGWFIRVA
jgi:hypothetical protein